MTEKLKNIRPKIKKMIGFNIANKCSGIWVSFPRQDDNPYKPSDVRDLATRTLKKFRNHGLTAMLSILPNNKKGKPISNKSFLIDSIPENEKIASPIEYDSDGEIWDECFSFSIAIWGRSLNNVVVDENENNDDDDIEDETKPNKHFWKDVNDKKAKKNEHENEPKK